MNRSPTDLVIVQQQTYSFDNRWRSSDEVIDPNCVVTLEKWKTMSPLNLKRVKLFDMPRDQLNRLLQLFSEPHEDRGKLAIEQLEITVLTLLNSFWFNYSSTQLRLLAIDSVIVVDSQEQMLPEAEVQSALISFNTPALSKVYLGSVGLNLIEFTHPQHIKFLSVDRDHTTSQFGQFLYLKVLECNRIERFRTNNILQFIQSRLGALTELHCNLGPPKAVDYKPEPGPLESFRHFYDEIRRTYVLNRAGLFVAEQGAAELTIRPDLQIYFNEVRIDPVQLEFEIYKFEKPLVFMHSHNKVINGLEVLPCRSVAKADYQMVLRFLEPKKWPDIFKPFAKRYPNVRQVTIHLDTRRQTELQPDELINFFSNCQGLWRAIFQDSRLKTWFYNALVRLDCCRTLSFLDIFESPPFAHCIDFSFLAELPFLKHFSTNAAPKQAMLNCLPLMRSSGQLFSFLFIFQASELHQYTFQRKAPRLWDLSIERAENRESNREFVRQNFGKHPYWTWDELVESLTDPSEDHWIPFDQSQGKRVPN